MLNLLLISLTFLATCFFGLWQMLVVPRRVVLQSLLDRLNELLASHRILSPRFEVGQLRAGDLVEETVKYGELFEHIFLDVSIDANKDLPETAKKIIEKYRDARLEGPPKDKYCFAADFLALPGGKVELDFWELSIFIEYAIKKMPYRPFRFLGPGVWLAFIRRRKSLPPSSSS